MDPDKISEAPGLFSRFIENKSSLSLWTTLVVLAVLNLTVFATTIGRATDDLKVQYIPDDAFYYLTLARNYASSGLWTFDSGFSVTSGFHLLFAYLLAIIYSILHLDDGGFVIAGMITNLLFTLTFIGVMWFWGFKQKNALFLMFLVLFITSRNFTYNSISVMEWALVILFASLYFVLFFARFQAQEFKTIDFLFLFFLGLLGSLARSDFVLLPLAITISALIISTSKKARLFAFSGLAGALTGVLIGFAHSYLFTNEVLQSSARMQAFWGQVAPANLHAPFLLVRALGYAGFFLLFIVVALFILIWLINKFDGRRYSKNTFLNNSLFKFPSRSDKIQDLLSPNNHRTHALLIISAGISLLAYFFLYSRGGTIQSWYTANLIVPVLMLIYGISGFISRSIPDKIWFLVLLLFLSAVIVNVSAMYPVGPDLSPYPGQSALLKAGNFLKEGNLPNRKIGAWNAGIVGYFAGGHIINLDGLVNNDIYEYAVDNNLPAYLESKNICCIVDSGNMFTEETHRIRGGYNDPSFLDKLQPQKVFSGGRDGWEVTLYQINKVLVPE